MAPRELCRAFLVEASAAVVKRVAEEDLDAFENSWYRAFQRTASTDLERAFELWFDSIGERRIDRLPSSGEIQVHLTALITARIGNLEEPAHWTPAREDFRAAHSGVRAQIETACRMERKVPHQHPKGVPSPEHMRDCGECARIDRVQALVAELLAELPEPGPQAPKRCTCWDASGWVQEQGGERRWYPCKLCNGRAFARIVLGHNDDDDADDQPKRLALAGGKRKRK